ncbi:MAG: hypothetical protein ABI867_22805 [Kofleriaceae bacterium]
MRRQTIAVLLVGQSAAFAAWWTVLLVVPASRAYFHVHEPSLLAFWLADAAVIATSLAAAFAVWRRLAWAPAAAWLAAGATGYAALYCIALWLSTGACAIGAITMTASAILGITLARST